jgi:NAD(P)-dependent dehydrogenase (short-subunit alcohol dehydrogenase family)
VLEPVPDTVAVVTGANAGLGFQTALALARGGATVVLACRSDERARRAQAELLAELPAARTSVIRLDVSEPSSIHEFVHELAARHGALDVLVNNAGVVAVPLSRNSLGHEMHLATNYLGAFALTGKLLPLFRRDATARVVNVGSLGHRLARLDLDDLNWERTRYGEWHAYFRSKLAMLGFTVELSRRLDASGGGIVAVGAHPGFAVTEASRNSAALTPKSALGRWLNELVGRTLIPSAADAARPIVHAARSGGVRGGDYYGPSGFLEIRGAPGKARVNPIARDAEIGRRLWALSESMTGVRYLSAP